MASLEPGDAGTGPPPAFDEPGRDWRARIAALPPQRAAILAGRARAAPLFAHAYAFHLNFRFGTFAPRDLLAFAADQRLVGVKIHVEDGEERSLERAGETERRLFAAEAERLALEIHVETSTTEPEGLATAVAIARDVGATSLRCYPRHAGRLSVILPRIVADLRVLAELDPAGQLRFTLEQHEDLRSDELVAILRAVDNPRLSLLFDFANMVNAGETPLAALARQAQDITEVHIKDCRVVPDRGGWAHAACPSGTGHLPMAAVLVELLLLGDEHPQVTAFGLEEEEDYVAPAFRFPGERPDPVIPARTASFTDPGAGPLPDRLAREREAAAAQVVYVRGLLGDIAGLAEARARARPASSERRVGPALRSK